MKRLGIALALLLTLLFAGCAATPTTTVSPGDGPAATETTGPVEGEPMDEPPTDEPSDPSTEDTLSGSFKDKITYPDGVAVEVIRVKQVKLGEYGGSDSDIAEGDPYQLLSIRVTNGSKKTIDVSATTALVSYGPDGEEAKYVYDEGVDDMSGKVLPGKAKTGTYGVVVPKKYLGDATVEFSYDYKRGPAIFTGSIG